jgi:hypothetical protein
MYPPEQDNYQNNQSVITSSSNGLESSNLIYTPSKNVSKANLTNTEKRSDDHRDRRQPSNISNIIITDHEISHPKHFIGMNALNGNTGFQQEETQHQQQQQQRQRQRQQLKKPQQCRPHPSQIRVSSPNNNNNHSNGNSSNTPSSSSTSDHIILPKEVQKPVIFCLQSSLLRNKARATNATTNFYH